MAESKKPAKAKSKVNEAGNYTKPELRKKLFNKIKAGTKGGDAGQWSARKAQLLASEYKKAGGGYKD
jgi:ABC-type transport system substrate-binding protein